MKVLQNVGNIRALFLCNFRLNHKLEGFIEDFHIRYIDENEMNTDFKYMSPLELEYGFSITTGNEVRLFCNDWNENNLKCHANYYMLGSGYGGYLKSAYETAYEVLGQTDNIKLAFVFTTDITFLYGAVLCSENALLSKDVAMQKMQTYGNECAFGKIYLAIVKADNSIIIQDVSGTRQS